jgi:hypothetical protein
LGAKNDAVDDGGAIGPVKRDRHEGVIESG